MDNGDKGDVPVQLSPEALSFLAEGISLVLSRWTALQVAIENEWGGRDSCQKSEQLALSIFSWFSQSKEPHYIDDLENMLDESMVFSFNTEIEDGSIEEVAEKLMIMHEDCLQGNYESIEKLRKSNSGKEAISQSRKVINEDDEDSSDDEVSDMMLDEPKPRLNPIPKAKPVDEKQIRETVEVEDGWSVVGPRRNKGKRIIRPST
ncbi:PREDICTED: pre-rRNA-processing protein TSR2-like [Nelumbo nucifera]|uniref:Pre-rRNA-processing protein TSR2-like n=2 Tax=Nelumbo nucifera TaxID=4432 RepID=A0A1U8B185_NELNU|nr:PREDICTED: pre-rRNA-processing protein TSR2-like [Nelumbo nucifera]DAD39546.1 TPA_asm: hypothetical protein HUJ06_013869 [Nelumbo nucifera]